MGLLNLFSKNKVSDVVQAGRDAVAKAKALGDTAGLQDMVKLGKDAVNKASQKATEMAQKQSAKTPQTDIQKLAESYVSAVSVAVYTPPKPKTGDKRLAGSQLTDLTTPEGKRLIPKGEPLDIKIGNIPIPAKDEQQHFLLAGSPGSGKSIALRGMLQTIRDRGQKCIIYDPVGDMVQQFYRPSTDHILNPLDGRDEGWNPWQDLELHEYPAFAKSIIPDPVGSGDPFWPAAAQAVLQALMLTQPDIDSVIRVGVQAPHAVLLDAITKAGKLGLVGDPEKTLPNIRASLAAHLDKLAILRNTRMSESCSLKKWTQDDTDNSWVFLLTRADTREAVKPLITIWLDTVVRTALSATPNPDRRIWLAIDELPSLGKIPSLAPALAEGRKYGLSAILCLQNVNQGRAIYGKEEFDALYSLAKTRLILRISDQTTASEMSKELGEIKVNRKTQSVSEGTNSGSSTGQSSSTSYGSNSGESINEAIVTEMIVLPSQIIALPDKVGYMRMGGTDHVIKIDIPYIPCVPMLVNGKEQIDHMPVTQRQMPWSVKLDIDR